MIISSVEQDVADAHAVLTSEASDFFFNAAVVYVKSIIEISRVDLSEVSIAAATDGYLAIAPPHPRALISLL